MAAGCKRRVFPAGCHILVILSHSVPEIQTAQPYTLRETALSRAAVRASLEKELRAALQERLGETGAVLSEYFTEYEENGMLTLTLRSECEERIDEETLRP